MDLRPSPKFLGNGQIIPQAILLALCGHRYRLETLETDFYLMFWVVPILGR
jgi:hypothetical protein